MPSAFDRLLWVINLLARNGFLVIPVSQLEQDSTLMEDRTQWAEASCCAVRLVTHAITLILYGLYIFIQAALTGSEAPAVCRTCGQFSWLPVLWMMLAINTRMSAGHA